MRRWSVWSSGLPVSRPACMPRRIRCRARATPAMRPRRLPTSRRRNRARPSRRPALPAHDSARAFPASAPAARPAAPFVHVQRIERPPIDPDLPADTPLEPGTGAARGRSPAERIAASEAALGPALGTLKREGEVTGKANFIAAARRAAQAAANEGSRGRGSQGRGAHARCDADQPDRTFPRQSPPCADASA